MLQVGIIGLPNVGKSTLFNALLRRQQALVANYPFATIEPNVGIVPVPDIRLDQIAEITKTEEKMATRPPIIPATVKFVDIAGLVKGAATGAGLGNKFLAHIREVDLICEVVRAFPDEDVIREGSVEPKSDIDIIRTELILADLQTLDKTEDKSPVASKLRDVLDAGNLAREVDLTEEETAAAREFQLLTAKKFVYVFNVNTVTKWPEAEAAIKSLGDDVCVVDAKLEAELSALNPDEQSEYLESLGIKSSGVDDLIRLAYKELNLISYFTTGVKETRAWTIPAGTKAPQAAGVIHTDFEKAFIKAEVIDYNDFVNYNGWANSRENGRVRLEGKEYQVKDGDVVEFKVNA